MNDPIKIRDSRFFDVLRDAGAADGMVRLHPVESKSDGNRSPRFVGRFTFPSKGGTASLERAILAYGDARQTHGSGEAVKRAWAACMKEIGA